MTKQLESDSIWFPIIEAMHLNRLPAPKALADAFFSKEPPPRKVCLYLGKLIQSGKIVLKKTKSRRMLETDKNERNILAWQELKRATEELQNQPAGRNTPHKSLHERACERAAEQLLFHHGIQVSADYVRVMATRAKRISENCQES